MFTISLRRSRRKIIGGATLLVLVFQLVNLPATEGRGVRYAQTQPDTKQVVAEFARGEDQLRADLDHYVYKWDLLVQTLKGGTVTGEFHRISRIALDSQGRPVEKIISFPQSSLTDLAITPDDLRDLSAGYQFALQTANLEKYKLSHLGEDRIDNAEAYLFEVKPKFKGKEDLFDGRVWVSVKDLRIVTLRGKWDQRANQRSPVIEIHRTLVDGAYLFPTSESADEELSFPNAPRVHIRIEVSYVDYFRLN